MSDKTIKRSVLLDVDSRVDGSTVKLRGLTRTIGTATVATTKLRDRWGGLVKSWAAIGIGVGVAIAGIRRLIRSGEEWSGTMRGVEGEVERLRGVVDSMIGNTALARLAEWRKELGLTQTEADAVAKAGITLGRINKVTFDQGLQSATTAVVGFEQEALKKLGIQIDLTGTKAEKQKQVINALVKEYGDLKIKTQNAGEEQAKVRNEIDDTIGRVGAAIAESESYRKTMGGLAKAFRLAAIGAGILDTPLGNLLKTMKGLNRVTNDYNRTLGVYRTSLTDMAGMFGVTDKLMEKRAKRAAQNLEREQRKYDAALAARKASRNRFHSEDYNAHVVALKKYQDAEDKAKARARVAEIRWERDTRNRRRREAKLLWDLREKDRKKAEEEQKRSADFYGGIMDGMAQSIVGNIAAVAAGEKSAGAAIKDATAGRLAGYAIEWGAIALSALGKYALSWGADASALAAFKFYSAAAAAAGVGSAAIGAIGGGGGGGGGGDYSAGTGAGTGSYGGGGSTSIARGESTDTGGGGATNVTNFNLYGRGGLMPTRKDLKAMSRRLAAGRIP